MSGEAQTSGRAALDGIRVLDLATPLGEATGRVFADLGAEVIKVEPPSGCESRFAPPFAKGGEGDPEGSLFWRVWGLGKKSVVLDLQEPADRDRFIELVRGADLRESSTIQLHLAERLKNVSFLQTRFLHHPLLIRPDGAKLSKSQGDATLKAMRESGTEASVVFEKFDGGGTGGQRAISSKQPIGWKRFVPMTPLARTCDFGSGGYSERVCRNLN